MRVKTRSWWFLGVERKSQRISTTMFKPGFRQKQIVFGSTKPRPPIKMKDIVTMYVCFERLDPR